MNIEPDFLGLQTQATKEERAGLRRVEHRWQRDLLTLLLERGGRSRPRKPGSLDQGGWDMESEATGRMRPAEQGGRVRVSPPGLRQSSTPP